MTHPSRQSNFRPTSDNTPMPLDEARARIIESIEPIGETETVALPEALHRVLAQSVTAGVDVPGSDNSAMDGYGYATADVPADGASLRVVGESLAGHPFTGRLDVGECIRIMTGAVVPAGVDTIVMQENTRAEDDTVIIERAPKIGSNIRPAGEDLKRGATVLIRGHYLRPADIAVLASVGTPEVTVYRRPRVAFFSTGDELRPINGPLAPGEIYDSNRYGLEALLAELGVEAINMGVIGDSPEALDAAFNRAAAEADAVVTSGGVSVGEADFVLDTLQSLGQVDFWRVAMKPGKPLAFGTLGKTRFFGLPGNPVSTAVTFMQLVRPALVRMAGGVPAMPMRFTRVTQTELEQKPGRENYMRGRLVDADPPAVRAIGHQGSGVMHSMSTADCFIVLAAESNGAAAGSPVTVEPFAQPIWGHPCA